MNLLLRVPPLKFYSIAGMLYSAYNSKVLFYWRTLRGEAEADIDIRNVEAALVNQPGGYYSAL
jgi:hypothetical protein